MGENVGCRFPSGGLFIYYSTGLAFKNAAVATRGRPFLVQGGRWLLERTEYSAAVLCCAVLQVGSDERRDDGGLIDGVFWKSGRGRSVLSP